MGLKDLIKTLFLRRAIKKTQQKSAVEQSVDSMLAEEIKIMSATNRTADKLLKVKIMRQETQHTLDKIGELAEDNEEDYEEEGDTFEEGIKKMLMNKILGGANLQPTGMEGVIPTEEEEAAANNPILDAVNNLTPQQTAQLKNKFLRNVRG